MNANPDRRYEAQVKEYYSIQGLKEWRRLTRDAYHQLEFNTTLHYLKKYLPKRGYILDAGGGPGRYTIELAKMGHRVALLDLTPQLLRVAERQIRKIRVEKNVGLVKQGTICNLSQFDDDTFDAVTCLGGPLSHVLDKKRREKSIDELIRVTKRGGPIFASVIGRLAVLVTELVRLPHEIELEMFKKLRDTGDYEGGYGFTPCHFYDPDELKEEFEKRGTNVLEMIGLEGLASGHPKETKRLFKQHPKAWKAWWETHLKTCTDSVSVGISEHFMIVCRK